MLTIQLETKAAVKELSDLGARLPRVLVMGLNKTVKKTRVLAKRTIAADTGMPAGAVSKKLYVKPATIANMNAILGASRKRIPAIDLGARGPEPSRGKGGGVSWKGGSDPHGFIATMPSGHRGVFRRKRTDRLPIEEIFGLSVGDVFSRHIHEFQAFAERELTKEIDVAIRFQRSGAME